MRGSSGSSFIRALSLFIRAPLLWPNHFLKTPHPNTIPPRMNFQHTNSGVCTECTSILSGARHKGSGGKEEKTAETKWRGAGAGRQEHKKRQREAVGTVLRGTLLSLPPPPASRVVFQAVSGTTALISTESYLSSEYAQWIFLVRLCSRSWNTPVRFTYLWGSVQFSLVT